MSFLSSPIRKRVMFLIDQRIGQVEQAYEVAVVKMETELESKIESLKNAHESDKARTMDDHVQMILGKVL